MGTPTGQKVRDVYLKSDKQVRDIHNEARRLANLKAGKNEAEPVGGTDKTVCQCGGDDTRCPCEEGKCACTNCGKATESAQAEATKAIEGTNEPKAIGDGSKTVCNCKADMSNCPCAPGQCACTGCEKATEGATGQSEKVAS